MIGRKRDLSEHQKGIIDTLINKGFSQVYVAAKLKVNKSTISRFVKGKRCSKKNSGSKKMTFSIQDRILKHLCLAKHKASSVELAREWRSWLPYMQIPAPSLNGSILLESSPDAW